MLLYLQRCPGQPLAPEYGWLDEAERERAWRFRRTEVRNEFITGRRLARLALSRLLGLAPDQACIVVTDTGQPRIAPVGATPEAHFSIAHSHGLVLCAASLGRRVGADVEPVSRAPELEDLLGRYLTATERQALARQPAAQRDAWMLRRWVDKEACSKVLGIGLQLPFECYQLRERDHHRVSLAREDDPLGGVQLRRWHPELEIGYLISVVCEADDARDPELEILDLGSAG